MASPVVEVGGISPTSPSVFYGASNPLRVCLEEVLIAHDKILERVSRLADDICRDHGSARIRPVVVMDGAYRFSCDLLNFLKNKVDCLEPLLISVKSYDGYHSTGKYREQVHPKSKAGLSVIDGSCALVVEDIADTGGTLDFLRGLLRRHGAVSVCGVVLLDKPAAHKVAIEPNMVKYRGFCIPDDKFVVGYGLDYRGRLRGEPHIGVLSPIGRERIDKEVGLGASCTDEWVGVE